MTSILVFERLCNKFVIFYFHRDSKKIIFYCSFIPTACFRPTTTLVAYIQAAVKMPHTMIQIQMWDILTIFTHPLAMAAAII